MIRTMFAIALILALAGTASAQGIYYPGSVWTSTGQTPVEKGNIISFTHAEQGIAYRGAELFGQTTVSIDSKNFDWNRRFTNGLGVRFTQSVGTGMIRVSTSYVRERRYTFERVMQGLVFSADAWFGWNNSPRPAAIK